MKHANINLSNDIQTNLSSNIQTDEISFHDYIIPALRDGNYYINVEQQIEDEGLQQSFESIQQFTISGNRFVLNPQEIHAVYPPIDGQGEFEHTLPQIILNNKTLPWQRSIDKQTPNLALLLFTPDELDIEDWTKVGKTGTVIKTIHELIHPEQGYLLPDIKDYSIDNDENKCLCIEINSQYFNQVVPRFEELKFLSHIREINSNNKTDDQTNSFFSTVFTNRLPQGNQRNIVHLVNLEGFTKNLQSDASIIDDGLKIRLISLASWEFYCEVANEEFEVALERLVSNHLPLRLHPNNKVTDESIEVALEGGYSPIAYKTRQGEQTTAFYRGPLVPNIVENRRFPACFSAEAAMIYNENTGMFDASYAVAWQTGRLLALSDSLFSKSLLDWKKQTNQFLDVFFAKQHFYKKIVSIYNLIQDDEDRINNFEDIMSDNVSNKLLALVFKQSLMELGLAAKGDIAGNRTREDLIHKAKQELVNLPGILTMSQFDTIKADADINQSLINLLFNP